MQDMRKTKAELVRELRATRRRVARLEKRANGTDARPRRPARARTDSEALRESQAMLRSILDNASTVIFVKDLEGKYLLINRRYEELFRVTNERIAGRTDYDVFPPEMAAQFQAKDRKALEAGGPIEEEELVPQEDGLHTYISVKFPLRNRDGEVYATCGIATDITGRKRTEEEAAELRRNVDFILGATHTGLDIIDRDYNLRYVSPGWQLTHGDPLGRKCYEYFQARDSVCDGCGLPRAFETGEPVVTELTLPREDDRPIQVTSIPFRASNGEQLAAEVKVDITERKRAEEALRQSHEMLERRVRERTAEIERERDFTDKALNSLPGLFYVFDEKGTLQRWNSRLAEVTGYTDEEIARRRATEYFAEEDRPQAIRAIRDVFRTGEMSTELSLYTKSGERIPYLFHGVRARIGGETYMVGMATDITERRRAWEAVREGERRYRTIFETAGTAMISFGDDGVIRLANDEWAAISGYSKEETIGRLTWMQCFTEQSLTKMRKYHQMRSKDPSSVPRAYEAQFVDRHGGLHDGIINIQMVPGTQQRVASFQDLTAVKRAQQEMYRADKMAALGQIIAGVAHEINNPNNFIYFNLPILRRYIDAVRPLLEHHLERDPDLKILNMPYEAFLEDVYKLLENMEHGSERITGIVSELKHYVRSDDDRDRRPGQVGEVIDRVMTLVGKQVRKMVRRFDVEVADGLPPVRMDAGKMEQVLINLVINAGQAADKPDSWVRLAARSVRVDDQDRVEIVVEDNGSGIPEENLEQIFEPFFTSKGREMGTGLGLSISQRIVEEHGGTIEVRSRVGEGAAFTIRLPVGGEE